MMAIHLMQDPSETVIVDFRRWTKLDACASQSRGPWRNKSMDAKLFVHPQ